MKPQHLYSKQTYLFACLTFLLLFSNCATKSQNVSSSDNTNTPAATNNQPLVLNKLTPEEEAVIVHKSTERPFVGEYTDNFRKGTYVCRQCNAPLYKSDAKFHSSCGWPSFDQEIPGAVKKTPDADGSRTEITCARCGGHLGHVFFGEGFTSKNTRHCVNSISMKFIEEGAMPKTQKAIYAGGCFWGVQYYMQKAKGVISSQVGYTGGHLANPTYRDVCSHTSGHYEAVEITFDPTQTTYEELTKLFFEIHDPTQADGQGPDHGEQYLSVVFYTDNAQKVTTDSLITVLKGKGYKVATQVKPATTFWPAEEHHQDYYNKEGATPYCHHRVSRF